MDKCVFCDIVGGRSPDSKIVFENERFIIIEDIKPASDFHYLALPKEHIKDCTKLREVDKPLGKFSIRWTECSFNYDFVFRIVKEMQQELNNLFVKKEVDLEDATFGFHWPPFNSISHLHMHAIAPVSKMNFISRWLFKPINVWYCTVSGRSVIYLLNVIDLDFCITDAICFNVKTGLWM